MVEGTRLAQVGSWAFNPSGFDYWSSELFEIHGLDATGKPPSKEEYLELVHSEDREFVVQQIQRMLTDHSGFDFTKRIVRPDGKVRRVRCVGTPTAQTGALRGFVGIGMDVTEQEQLTEELVTQELRSRESQRELSLIIDNIPGLVWCASIDGQLTHISKRLSEYVGASVDNLWDTGWLDAVHPDDRAIALDTWRRCVATGAPLENQYRLRGADGVYRWFHVPRQLVHTSDGQPLLWYGLLVDIEERKNAEQALRQQESELRQLLDFMPPLVVVFGPGHDRLYANRAALEYRGLGLNEWREASTVHPDDQKQLREYADRASFTGAPYDLEVRLCNREGHHRWFLARYSPMHDEKGKVKYWYVALTDIEDRKKAEERLQQENLALREEVDHASMFEEIVGASPALRKALSRVSKVAPSDSTVLVTGETGVGKELIARYIHRRSNRASRAFISVNCAAISRELVHSELFGHEKGAFTGATQRRIGRFELADGGSWTKWANFRRIRSSCYFGSYRNGNSKELGQSNRFA